MTAALVIGVGAALAVLFAALTVVVRASWVIRTYRVPPIAPLESKQPRPAVQAAIERRRHAGGQ